MRGRSEDNWVLIWIIVAIYVAISIYSVSQGGTFGPDYTGSPLPR
jgi:hypothetical protein